jgi:hypothetical protein
MSCKIDAKLYEVVKTRAKRLNVSVKFYIECVLWAGMLQEHSIVELVAQRKAGERHFVDDPCSALSHEVDSYKDSVGAHALGEVVAFHGVLDGFENNTGSMTFPQGNHEYFFF